MNISKRLEEIYSTTTTNTIINLNQTEKLILALTFKTGKSASMISRLLKINIQTIRNYVSNLKAHGLIRTRIVGFKQHKSYIYIFDATKEQLKSCPSDLVDYIKAYWGQVKK